MSDIEDPYSMDEDPAGSAGSGNDSDFSDSSANDPKVLVYDFLRMLRY